jgi:flagellar FliL protein
VGGVKMASGNSDSVSDNAVQKNSTSGGKLLVILSFLNSLITIGIFCLLYFSFQKDKKNKTVSDINLKDMEVKASEDKEHEEQSSDKDDESDESEDDDFGKMINLEQFTVNLMTSVAGIYKFVRVNVSLEVPNNDVENEVNAKIPQIRNVIIDLINSKKPSDVSSTEGREYLKEDIKNTVNSFLMSGKIKGVFFTSFALAS